MTSPLDATATAFGGAPLAPSTRGFAPPSVSQRCSTSICYLFENYCNLLLQFAKRKLTFLLAMFLGVGILCQSCGSEMNVEEKNVTTDNSTTQGVETDYLDSLGEKDFNGAIYTIRTQSVTGAVSIFNMHCGEITGEVVNDAQYNRDKYIEQRYNVVMEYLETDPNTNGQELANSMFAGDS